MLLILDGPSCLKEVPKRCSKEFKSLNNVLVVLKLIFELMSKLSLISSRISLGKNEIVPCTGELSFEDLFVSGFESE